MQICCIETTRLPPAWTEKTAALAVDFFSGLSITDVCWVDRPLAETTNAYKQIIPYVVVQSKERILCYPRHGTESRLHGLYSCGIGGHIDMQDAQDTLEQTVIAGMMRELHEELAAFQEDKIQLVYRGIINEAATPVGQVHLGLVYTACCLSDYTPQPAEELKGMTWKTIDELTHLTKELWTNLALDLLDKL